MSSHAPGDRSLAPDEVEAFVADLIETRLREFRTLALLFGGDDADIESIDRIEHEVRADCARTADTMRARLRANQ